MSEQDKILLSLHSLTDEDLNELNASFSCEHPAHFNTEFGMVCYDCGDVLEDDGYILNYEEFLEDINDLNAKDIVYGRE